MKKILLTAFISAFTLSAFSQDKPLKFGVKAGVNFANVVADTHSYKMKTGFHAGLLAEYSFNEHFSLQPEVIFSSQGTKEDFDQGIDLKRTYELNYINVPVIAKYNNFITKGLSLGAGPQIGFLTSAKLKQDGEFIGESDDSEVDVKENYKSVDFSLVLNAEYELDFGLFFQLRHNIGFSNINDVDEQDSVDTMNSVFSISAGYKF